MRLFDLDPSCAYLLQDAHVVKQQLHTMQAAQAAAHNKDSHYPASGTSLEHDVNQAACLLIPHGDHHPVGGSWLKAAILSHQVTQTGVQLESGWVDQQLEQKVINAPYGQRLDHVTLVLQMQVYLSDLQEEHWWCKCSGMTQGNSRAKAARQCITIKHRRQLKTLTGAL
jgi:hypothetical protein